MAELRRAAMVSATSQKLMKRPALVFSQLRQDDCLLAPQSRPFPGDLDETPPVHSDLATPSDAFVGHFPFHGSPGFSGKVLKLFTQGIVFCLELNQFLLQIFGALKPTSFRAPQVGPLGRF
jgi:hypothetical protein